MKPCVITATGTKHGRLTILGKGQRCGHNYKYRFTCECGTTFEAEAWGTIARGHCGCLKPSTEERLVRFLTLNEATGCWEFGGCLNNNGYGQIGIGGRKLMYAHRIAWLIWKGDIADGLCVLHRCDNGKCCNPDHLFLGTIADNNSDCRLKGRHGNMGRSPVNWRVIHSKHSKITDYSGQRASHL